MKKQISKLIYLAIPMLIFVANIIFIEKAYAINTYVNPYSCFNYDILNDEEKIAYFEIADIISNYKSEVDLSTLDVDVVNNAVKAVIRDKPEFFYFDWYNLMVTKRNNRVINISFNASYLMDKETAKNKQNQIEYTIKDLITNAENLPTDYDKALAVYTWIIQHTEYQINLHNSSKIDGIILDKRGQCAGYAQAVQYILNKLGISAGYITGVARNEPHAWNIVKLDNEYYHMDATWGDPIYSDSSIIDSNAIDYTYFAMNETQIRKTRTINEGQNIPNATSTKYNYFNMEGLHLKEYSLNTIYPLFFEACKQKQSSITLQFETVELCNLATKSLIENNDIDKILQTLVLNGLTDVSTENVRYSQNGVHLKIFINYKNQDQNNNIFLSEYSIDIVYPIFQKACQNNKSSVELKFTTSTLCEQAVNSLMNNSEIFEILQRLNNDGYNVSTQNVRYSYNYLYLTIQW